MQLPSGLVCKSTSAKVEARIVDAFGPPFDRRHYVTGSLKYRQLHPQPVLVSVPTFHIFVINNLPAWAMFGLCYSHSSNTGGPTKFDFNSTSIAAGPTVRYYFPVSEKIYLFPEVDLAFARIVSRDTPDGSPTVESTTTQSLFRAGLGATYFLAKNVGFEGFAYYQNLNS